MDLGLRTGHVMMTEEKKGQELVNLSPKDPKNDRNCPSWKLDKIG